MSRVTWVPDSNLLAGALAILLKSKKLLVVENKRGTFDLPGLVVAKGDQVSSHLNLLIKKLKVNENVQQSLYLTRVPVPSAKKKTLLGVIRIIHLKTVDPLDVPNSHFESLTKLVKATNLSPALQMVVKWLLRN